MGQLAKRITDAVLDRVASQSVPRLTYSPGPGIYSRMERAVEAMPPVVQVQELPGLLRRHKEGVPGWEVNAVAPALEGVRSLPRSDLLDLVRQRSPLFTHREMVLGGRTPRDPLGLLEGTRVPFQDRPSPIGDAVSHGNPIYESYGQGGKYYSELLLLQPGAGEFLDGYGNHWKAQGPPAAAEAVAHARYDTHGDALRINELQSDLGVHNRKARESMRFMGDGNDVMLEHPFPMEDAWLDLLIKRVAMEAARGGHRAIEVASPQAIAEAVGGNIDKYKHLYGKVVPGAMERLGRKMGGAARGQRVPERVPQDGWFAPRPRLLAIQETSRLAEELANYHGGGGNRGQFLEDRIKALAEAVASGEGQAPAAEALRDRLVFVSEMGGWPESAARVLADNAMPGVMRRADELVERLRQSARLRALRDIALPDPPENIVFRYPISDEMRRRILQQGIGAAVAAPVAAEMAEDGQ